MSTILIVEDDLTLNSALKEKLEHNGFNVVSAHNGEEGLRILSSMGIDLILMDVVMPQMDGIEMIYHWNQKQTKKIPTIILTNLSETAYPENITKIFIKSNTSLNEIVDEVKQTLAFSTLS